MTICLVTDRRRLAANGTPEPDVRRCLLAQARCAVEAGIDLIQVRERDLETAALAALVAELLTMTRRTTTRLIVNDRLDVALACGADGVQLRSDSISPDAARSIAPSGFLIGCSVHDVDEAKAARRADFLIAGTVFSSTSKPEGHPLLGVEGLRAIVSAVSIPVLAIGGLAADRIGAAAAAGASGIAAIGLFMQQESSASGCRAVDLRGAVAQARAGFDSVRSAP